MRPFSKLEKDFIDHVLELDKKKDLIYVHNVLSEFYNKNFEIDFYGYEVKAANDIGYIVTLRFKNEQYVSLNGIIGDLISLTHFLDYMLNNEFLVREKIKEVTGHRYINQFVDRNGLLEYEIQSNTVKTNFAENLQYKFYATELLRELKANKYATFEKKEAKLTRKIAFAGLVIAIVSLIISSLMPLIKQEPVKIDKNSLDYFIKAEKQK